MSPLSSYLLVVVAITLSCFSTSSANESLDRLYQVAKYRALTLDSHQSQLYTDVKIERFDNIDLAIPASSVSTISEMEQVPDYFVTFRQFQAVETSNLISQHLACLTKFQQALTLIQLDEVWIGEQDESTVTYENNLRPVINEANNLRATFMRIIHNLGGNFDPSTVTPVTFETCDVDCTKKRGVFILQEFNYYVHLTKMNLASLCN